MYELTQIELKHALEKAPGYFKARDIAKLADKEDQEYALRHTLQFHPCVSQVAEDCFRNKLKVGFLRHLFNKFMGEI